MAFSPEWRALGRKAALASKQIASGITALGHANHAETGLYNQADPIAAWWERAALPILAKHYGEKQRNRDTERAEKIAAMLGTNAVAFHHREDGGPVTNVKEYVLLGGATRVVQTYGRLYTLQIVRWISLLLHDLSRIAAYEKRVESMLGLGELFSLYMNEDKYLRERKRWSAYRLR